MNDREEQIRELLPVVRSIARRLKRMVPSADLDDLIGDGCVGLIQAVDAYDPARGPSLDWYARRIVLGAMLNGIRRMDPVSERARRIAREGDGVRYALATACGALPTRAEIERRCPGYGQALATVRAAQPLSLDAPLPLGERRPGDVRTDPARVVERSVECAAFAAALGRLPARQRQVIVEYYFGGYSLRSIGRHMAISSQRASQLHVSAIRRMRGYVRAAPG